MQHLLAPLSPEEIARRDRASVEEDVAPWRGSTVGERVRAVRGLLRLATASLAVDGPHAQARRDWQDPRSAEAEALWCRLVREYRDK